MKQFISPHVHIKSFDSASSPEKFATRLTEMGSEFITITDHGTLTGTREVYDITKKDFKNLTPILGVEGYMRDESCPIFKASGAPLVNGTYEKHMKYMHVTLHATDEKAYSALSRILSVADLRSERHGSERKPLFDWANLEELGSYNITGTSGCLIGMVSRHLLNHNDPVSALKYYEKLRSCFKPGNFYVEIFPHQCDRNWESKVSVTDDLEKTYEYQKWNQVKTRAGTEPIKMEELAKEFHSLTPKKASAKHIEIVEALQNRKWVVLDQPVKLSQVKLKEGWLYNECLPWCPEGDVQLGANRFLMELANRYKDPILISDDSHFAYPDERVVQDIRLGQSGSWRFANSHHLLTSQDAWNYFSSVMPVERSVFDGWVENSYEWANKFKGFSFTPRKSLPVSFYPQDTLKHTMELIQRHGRMDWNNKEWIARLDAEIQLLHKNGTIDLLPYFFLDEEVCRLYTQNGQLTGAGRGSAAGLLLTYLLNITHVNPIKRKLSMDRFLTLDRIQTGKMPDIDQDVGDRTLLEGTKKSPGWLEQRFGKDHVARICTETKLKLKSAIKDTFRATAHDEGREQKVPSHIEDLCRALPDPPQGIDDIDVVFGYEDDDKIWHDGLIDTSTELQKFVAQYPKHWEIVKKLLGLTRQRSVHACGFLISNDPIHDYIPLQSMSETTVTSFAAPQVEASGGLKMDFLKVDVLKDLGTALNLINKYHPINQDVQEDSDGVKYLVINGLKVPLFRAVLGPDGKPYDIWDLPDDPNVFGDIANGKVAAVFQLDAPAAKQGLKQFAPLPDGTLPINDLEGLSAFTSLDRPGPLDARVSNADGVEHNMLVEFANRSKRKERIGEIELLNEMLPETFGILVYQEQLQFVFQHIGNTTAIEADKFRQRIGKKKLTEVNKIDRPIFMKGAVPRLGQEQATVLWNMMETFGQYGFNKSMLGTVILPYNGGSKQIQQFTGGEIVNCLDESGNLVETKVLALHDHGVLPAFEIEFDDGEKITTTANHKFLTEEGQRPLYDIINSNRGVWSRLQINDNKSTTPSSQNLRTTPSPQTRRTGTGLDVSMRSSFLESASNAIPSSELPAVHNHQERKYSGPSIEAQYQTGTTASCFDSSKENVRSQRYSIRTSCTDSQVASREPQEDSSNLGICTESSQALQDGSMVTNNRSSNMAGSSYSLWRDSEAGGFCKSGPQNLGGSGRLLPFLRSVETEPQITNNPVPRRHVESRSISAWRCDVDSFSGFLFQKLGRYAGTSMAELAYSDAPIPKARGMVLRRIVRVRYVGERQMYDLEVAHPKHNFLLQNGVVTSNSHAMCYMATAYACAWLKHYYPLEWWTSVLQNATDRNKINEKYWAHCGHLIDLPDISYSTETFEIQNGRIRAPLSLIKGVGDKAFEQLMSLAPFTDIKDMMFKIQHWKINHSTPKVDKKTGEVKIDPKTGQQVMAKGRSAITAPAIENLIVSGALNSLFPSLNEIGLPLSLEEKLSAYVFAAAEATGKQPTSSIATKYMLTDPLVRFQLQKGIMPALGQVLAPIVVAAKPDMFTSNGKAHETEFGWGSNKRTISWGVVTGAHYENLKHVGAVDMDLSVAVMAYVVAERKFSYTHKETGDTRYATELDLDMDGVRTSVVKWGGSHGLPESFKENLTGAVLMCLFLRRAKQLDWYFTDAVMLAEPIKRIEKEESST